MTIEKTHWLYNPNKNYLGHQDLPNGENATLTLLSGKWEIVVNPKLNTKTEKRVLRFAEDGKKDYKWVKPFICNETNALDICRKLQIENIEDSIGSKITFTIKEVKVGKITTKALRIYDAIKKEERLVSDEDVKRIASLIDRQSKVDAIKICESYKIDSLKELQKQKLDRVIARLNQLIEEEE